MLRKLRFLMIDYTLYHLPRRGFLLWLPGEPANAIRVLLRRQKTLKVAVQGRNGQAYSPAQSAQSPAIIPH